MRRFLFISWICLAVSALPSANAKTRFPYAATAPAQSINSYFDPQAEFLELGVQIGSQATWKLLGPDLNGVYGGENGAGGLEGISPYLNNFNPVISDARGNVLGEVTNGAVSWFASRPTAYGAVPGYRPVAFGNGGDLAQASAWRGKSVDVTGNYQIGLRAYTPVSGTWLSHDSVFDYANPNGYSYCGGDPVNYFDPDGRFGKGGWQSAEAMVSGTGQLLWNAGGTIGYGATSLFSQEAANNIYGNQWNGLKNVGKGFAYLGNQAWQGNWNTVGKSLTGGENQSGAFRVGYAGVGVASLFVGGELGEVGIASRSAEVADAAGQAAMRARVLADISTRGLSRSSIISTERAQQLLIRNGFSTQRASDYLASFEGPITARIVEPGENFLRYTDIASSKGNFVGQAQFLNPAYAVEGLYLAPYGNTASLVQDVIATSRNIVLEGKIANGGREVQQTLIINRNAFQFGIGRNY